MLESDPINLNIKNEVGKYQSDIVQEVAKAVVGNRLVIVGTMYNLWINRVRELFKK